MERMKLTLSTVLLATTFLGCNNNTTTLQYDPSLHTVWVRVPKGGKIQFKKGSNDIFVPTFSLGAPCTDENDLMKGTCTIAQTAAAGVYPYTCPDCQDPEIVVESDIGPLETKRLAALPSGGIQGVFMACINKMTIKIFPTEVKEHKADELTIHWQGGGATPLTDWTVTDFKTAGGAAADVCKQTPPFVSSDPAKQECTLDQGKVTAGMTYTYAVTSTACSAAAQGQITILP
jgi:hypothetical protein